MAYNIAQNIHSDLANQLNINNFPGIDKNYDPCLTREFIFYNLNLLYYHCVNPILNAFGTNDIAVTSAYRCRALQKAMGGNLNSPHTRGQAIDIISYSKPTDILWNWCYQNLPMFNQLIWEYPERGNASHNYHADSLSTTSPIAENFSWVHITFIKDNNPKTSSLSSKREDLHEMYESDLTTRIGDYTHNIVIADKSLL